MGLQINFTNYTNINKPFVTLKKPRYYYIILSHKVNDLIVASISKTRKQLSSKRGI